MSIGPRHPLVCIRTVEIPPENQDAFFDWIRSNRVARAERIGRFTDEETHHAGEGTARFWGPRNGTRRRRVAGADSGSGVVLPAPRDARLWRAGRAVRADGTRTGGGAEVADEGR